MSPNRTFNIYRTSRTLMNHKLLNVSAVVSKPNIMLRKILRQAPSSSPAISTPDLGRDEPMEEERVPHTALRCFYPMHLGDVLNDRYLVTAKLGYGGRSTVWLAKDLHRYECSLSTCLTTTRMINVMLS